MLGACVALGSSASAYQLASRPAVLSRRVSSSPMALAELDLQSIMLVADADGVAAGGKALAELQKTAGPAFDSFSKSAGPLLESTSKEAAKTIEAAIPEIQKGIEASKPVLEQTAKELAPVVKQGAEIVAPVLQQALVSAGTALGNTAVELGKQAAVIAVDVGGQEADAASAALASNTPGQQKKNGGGSRRLKLIAATPRHAYSATRTAGGLAAIVPLGEPTRAHAHSLPGNLDAAAAKSASLPQKESIDAVRRPSLLTWAGGAPWLGGGHSFARPSAIAPHLAPSRLSPHPPTCCGYRLTKGRFAGGQGGQRAGHQGHARP